MKHFFLPTQKNNHYPHILKPLVFALAISTIALGQFLLIRNLPEKTLQASDLTLENIMAGVNNERILRNIPALNADSRLTSAAQSKSDDMQARHYFSHTDPEGHYVWDKIVAAGYTPYAALGENLAIEFYTTESLITAWMNSPTHRQNLLNDTFKDQGMGLNMGDTTIGQYHSAITNTFGVLQITKTPNKTSSADTTQKKVSPAQAPIAKPTPRPTPTPTPTKATPSTILQPAALQQPENLVPSKTQNAPGGQPLNIRSEDQKPQPVKSENTLAENLPQNTPIDQPVVGNKENAFTKNVNMNLVLGGVLVLLLLADLKLFQSQRYPNLDKKINSIWLLLLAIILTGVLYWL